MRPRYGRATDAMARRSRWLPKTRLRGLPDSCLRIVAMILLRGRVGEHRMLNESSRDVNESLQGVVVQLFSQWTPGP